MTCFSILCLMTLGVPKALDFFEEIDPAIVADPHAALPLDGRRVRDCAMMAEQLLARGTPDALSLAERLLAVVIASQETRPGAAHLGNFPWVVGDEVIADLNSVEFTLKPLIALLIRYEGRLSPALRERLRECLRLGLEEIRALDVAPTYTNVATMDVANSCLGGEYLDDGSITERGYAKLRRLTDLAAANGTIFEFDSPTYHLVTLESLKQLADMTRNQEARMRARTLAARLGLGMALHLHRGTSRWGGPHSRAYYDRVVGEAPPELDLFRAWLDDGLFPDWVAVAYASQTLPMQIHETSSREWGMTSTAYHTPAFALGVASREVSWQSDVFMVHYRIPGSDQPGIVYSRYLIDDTWFTNPEAAHDPSNRRKFVERGKFFGVQHGPRCIGIYAPHTLEHFASFAPCSRDTFASAKAAIVWTQRPHLDEIWVGPRKVEAFPAEVAPGEVVVVGGGDIYVAIRPLTRTDLGYGAPIRLVEAGSSLILEMYNYLGPQKTHNTLERRSRFYQGQVQCGFYAEVATKADFPGGGDFARTVASGTLTDTAPPPFTAYEERADRPWTVEYRRDGLTLGLEVNLMEWELKRRWNQDGALGWPMLESPMARQNDAGLVEVGDAVLRCGKAPAWLLSAPEHRLWVAGYHGAPAPLRLTTPEGDVDIQAMGIGMVVWREGKVTVEAVGLEGLPRVQGGTLVAP